MRSALILPLVGLCSATPVILAGRSTPVWTYQGCYLDAVSNRTLAYSSNQDSNDQTTETCTSFCAANGYSWAGTEYGAECYCDYDLSGATKEPDSDCSMKCAGNSSETCGNGNRLSVYYNAAGPVTNPGPSGWTLVSCYTDSVSARTLSSSQAVSAGSSGMTVAQCTAACQSAGYSLAGVEYANECYCDNAIRNSASVVTSGCNMLCSGNSSEYCGGASRVDVYQISSVSAPTTGTGSSQSGWASLGCYTDNAGSRTLATQQSVPGGASNMTVEGCLGACSKLGYSYGGVEYAQECFCGSGLQNGGTCASDQSTCYQPCKGNTAEVCGGPNRLNMYYSGSDPSVVACSSSASSSSSSSKSTTTTSTSSSVAVASSSSLSTSTSSASSSSTSTSSVSTSSTSVSSTSSSSSSSTSTSSSSSATSSPITSTSSSTSSSSSTTTSTTSSASSTSTDCPSYWTDIANDLAPSLKANGLCTDMARAAIRYAFHDAASFSTSLPFYSPAAGGADGSLLLAPGEINRTDHNGLHDYHDQLLQKFNAYKAAGYGMSAADLIQFAAALGVLACPGGRIGRVLVGRTDTTQIAPDGLLPVAFGAGSDHDTILNMFVDKGFTARDLAALLGAHTSSIARFQASNGIPVGTPQDDTPGAWDVSYYNETYNPPAGIGRFDSDINLSVNTTTVGKQFNSFVGAQGAWGASFSSAFQTLSTLGLPVKVRRGLLDCTNVVSSTIPPT